MKVCSICKTTQHESSFFFRNKEKNQLHASCKACYKTHRTSYAKQHYQQKAAAYRARVRSRKSSIKADLRAKMTSYLQH